MDIVGCDGVTITNSYIDASDDDICLGSHDAKSSCKRILIQNCTIRSSANGIKFGTASRGGFSKIKILKNKVFDTYRSAITLAAADGAYIEVDSLQAFNTGNAIFLRIGERIAGKKGRMENLRISNVHVEIPATKPDAMISNVTLTNIEIKYPGGGNPFFA